MTISRRNLLKGAAAMPVALGALPAEGQEWWRARGDADADHALAMERAAASREAAALAVP